MPLFLRPMLAAIVCSLSVHCYAQLPVTSGLKLHLDAAVGYNANGAAPSTWADQSSSGNNMISGTGSKEPTYVTNVLGTGFSGVQFDGTDDYMINQTLNSTFSDSQSTLIVVRIGANVHATGIGGSYRSNISIADDSTFHDEMAIGSDWGLHHTFSGNWTWRTHTCYDSLPANKPVIISTILGKQTSSIEYFLNGNQSTTSIGTQGGPVAYSVLNRRILIGARFEGNSKTGTLGEYYTGYMLEIIGYNRKLSVAEMIQVDTYLVHKYYPSPSYTLVGDTVCPGQQAHLTYTNPGGPATATITYSDGTNTYNRTVQNGVPFSLTPNPTTTTTYTIGGGASPIACTSLTSASSSASGTVVILPQPTANAGNDTSVCGNTLLQLSGSGGVSYSWYPTTNMINPTSPTPYVYLTTTTTYNLIVTGANGCTDTDNVVLTRNPIPVANAGNDTAACTNDVIQLKGSGGGTYNWSPSTGLSSTSSANPLLTVTGSGTYSLVVTNTFGCKDTDDVIITANPLPVANAGNDTTVCRSVSIQLHGSGGVSYSWSPNSNMTNANTASPTVTVGGDTHYVLSVRNSFGCSDTDGVDVNVIPFDVNAGIDTAVCPDSTIQLHATGGTSYKWYGGSYTSTPYTVANPTVTIQSNTTFYLVGTNSIGCVDTDEVLVSIVPMNFKITPEQADLCIGDSLTITASGGNIYSWWPGSASSQSIVVRPTVNTVYNVSITETTCNRSDTLSMQVTIRPLPEVKASKSNDVSCAMGTVNLTATGADSFAWSPAVYLDNANSATPKANPKQTTHYVVTGITKYGCKDSAQIDVNVKTEGDVGLIIPDAFTPNGDGRNECYRLRSLISLDAYELSIYNRWGEQVFHSSNISDCWDGSFKGQPLELGTYYYFLRIKTNACGEILKKGDILLVR